MQGNLMSDVDLKSFVDEYPQPLDPIELVSANQDSLQQSGEGGVDDTWYHDNVDGNLDDEWQQLADKIIKRELLKGEVEKHLPNRHDQETHGNEVGTSRDVKNNVTDLTSGPHYLRHKTGEHQVGVTLKNGEKRTRTVFDFKFVDDTGKEVTDAETLSRLRKAVPPNVSNVVISRNPDSHIIATWRDSKGRFHAMYSKAHAKEHTGEKFARLKAFNKVLPKIRRQVNEDLNSTDDKVRETAEILYMIDKTGFRIGGEGETLAAVQAYGASTLLSKHVRVDGNKVTFDFIGKKGVRIQKSLRDDKLAEIINKHKSSQWSQKLFSNSDSLKVRAYLKRISGNDDFVIKDFRTWHGTNEALRWIKRRKGPAASEKQFKKWQYEVGDKVAKHLGNTRGVALNSYIAPQVWDTWRKSEWGPWLSKDLKEEKHLPGKHDQKTHGRVFYHGTRSEAAGKIVEEGIQAGKGGTSDIWGQGKVYVSTNLQQARFVGIINSLMHSSRSEAVVFEIVGDPKELKLSKDPIAKDSYIAKKGSIDKSRIQKTNRYNINQDLWKKFHDAPDDAAWFGAFDTATARRQSVGEWKPTGITWKNNWMTVQAFVSNWRMTTKQSEIEEGSIEKSSSHLYVSVTVETADEILNRKRISFIRSREEKHLPGKHDQQAHGRNGKTILPKYIIDDAIARLPKHLQDVKVIQGGKRIAAFERDSFYDYTSKTIYFDPVSFSQDITSTSSDLNGDRIALDSSAGAKVVNNVGMHLLGQTIRHELGHHVWYSLSDNQQQEAERILGKKSKIMTPTIFRYADYYDTRATEIGHRPPGYNSRIRHEQFAEAIRWKLEKNPRWNTDVPISLRRLIDDVWTQKISKSFAASNLRTAIREVSYA